jgi:16S rRNA C967 or C1407 C5-methylase (RsmB/RsmF family)
MLPIEFQLRMKEMLQDEYEEFQKCFEEEKHQGLRLNPLKVDRDVFLSKTEFNLKKIPWASYGFYYEDADTPGKHPFHEAGAYYIQEPSAMAPVEYLGVRPGDKILDLCAAPGRLSEN